MKQQACVYVHVYTYTIMYTYSFMTYQLVNIKMYEEFLHMLEVYLCVFLCSCVYIQQHDVGVRNRYSTKAFYTQKSMLVIIIVHPFSFNMSLQITTLVGVQLDLSWYYTQPIEIQYLSVCIQKPSVSLKPDYGTSTYMQQGVEMPPGWALIRVCPHCLSSQLSAGEESLRCCQDLCEHYDIRFHNFNPLLSRHASLSVDVPLEDVVESVMETIPQVVGRPLHTLLTDINNCQ